MLARILAQSEAANVVGQARAAAEAELELVRARAVIEAVLTRAENTGHSPNEGGRYEISEPARLARKTYGELLEVEFGFVLPFR